MTPTIEKILSVLKQKTPEGVNPVDLLTSIIPMSKEAAYRRLRGQIEFSFDEVVKIAQELNISLDGITKTKNKNESFLVNVTYIGDENSFMEDYVKWGERTLRAMRELRACPNHTSLSINNNISVLYLFRYELISKLRTYKWMYQRNPNARTIKMLEFTIPSKAVALEKLMVKELQQTHIVFIYSQELIKSLVNDILYFRNLSLLSEGEYNQMIDEAFLLLDDMEHDAILGKNQEMPCSIHVSNIEFDNDFVLWESDTLSKITFRLFGVNHYSIDDQRVILEMRNWVNMLLKSSTLISFSGEKKRMEFFQHQRKLLTRLST